MPFLAMNMAGIMDWKEEEQVTMPELIHAKWWAAGHFSTN